VRPSPLDGMDSVRTIEFADALARLQALIGEEVRVLVNFRETFGGCALEGRLTRVHTLPPDYSAVDLLIDDRQGLMLDPVDTEVLLAEEGGDQGSWLEFHLPSGIVASVEATNAS
jgi:hypothetical protein